MEMSPINVNFSYKIVASTQFSELLLCLLFLKNSQFKIILGFPGVSDGKESARSAGDPGSIRGWERSPGRGNGNPLQYSCLENPMDGGAWDSPWGPKESDMTEQLHLCQRSIFSGGKFYSPSGSSSYVYFSRKPILIVHGMNIDVLMEKYLQTIYP